MYMYILNYGYANKTCFIETIILENKTKNSEILQVDEVINMNTWSLNNMYSTVYEYTSIDNELITVDYRVFVTAQHICHNVM